MMLQLPIVAIQKSRFFRGRTILNVSCFLLFDILRFSLTSFLECLLLVLNDLGSVYGKLYIFTLRYTTSQCFWFSQYLWF